AIAQHELDFVLGAQRLQVLHVKSVGLARIRALHIDNLDDILGHSLERSLAAGLDQHRVALAQQALHQQHYFPLLQHRFAARNLHQAAAAQALDFFGNLFHRHAMSAGERVLAVAPRATEVAASQADEDARQSRVRRLALDRLVNLCNLHSGWLLTTRCATAPNSLPWW